MNKQSKESRQLAEALGELEMRINVNRGRLIIEDMHNGQKYRLARSFLLGGNTDDPTVVLQIREEK